MSATAVSKAFDLADVVGACQSAVMARAPERIDAERRALIEEIQAIEGAPVAQAPLLFHLVILCGGAVCAGAGGGLTLGVADLIGRVL